MTRKLLYSLPCVLLAACADTSEKYRDIQHLELPPTLAVEHNNTPAEPDRVVKAESKSGTESDKSKNTELGKLILLVGNEDKPTLQMKTRFDRAWDLVDRGLQLAEIEVVDKNRDAGVIRVHYVADGQGKGRRFLNSITSMFSDQFEDTEYTLTIDKDKKITDIRVDKVAASKADADGTEAFNNDDSASLIKLLHKSIIADLEK